MSGRAGGRARPRGQWMADDRSEHFGDRLVPQGARMDPVEKHLLSRGLAPLHLLRRLLTRRRYSGTASLLADERFVEVQVAGGVLVDRRDPLGVCRHATAELGLIDQLTELRRQI